MRACARPEKCARDGASTEPGRCWRRVAALLLGLAVFGRAMADFKVADVQPKFADQALMLSGNIDLGLSSPVEEALSKGIPLEVIIEVRLYRYRRFLWDKQVAAWTLRRSIQYHALSGQYLVSAGDPGAETRESLLTQQEALKSLGSLNELRLPLKDIAPADNYSVDVRASLDIEALPTPLRPVAYTSFAWHLNSGWTTWKVTR
jgi:hypothetical protein